MSEGLGEVGKHIPEAKCEMILFQDATDKPAVLGHGVFPNTTGIKQVVWCQVNPSDCTPSPVLTRDQVIALIAHLQAWLDTGSLKLPDRRRHDVVEA